MARVPDAAVSATIARAVLLLCCRCTCVVLLLLLSRRFFSLSASQSRSTGREPRAVTLDWRRQLLGAGFMRYVGLLSRSLSLGTWVCHAALVCVNATAVVSVVRQCHSCSMCCPSVPLLWSVSATAVISVVRQCHCCGQCCPSVPLLWSVLSVTATAVVCVVHHSGSRLGLH